MNGSSNSMLSRALTLLLAVLLWAACTASGVEEVRQPAAAGKFYPGEPTELREEVAYLLQSAEPQVPADLQKQRPIALIVPHAAYRYSGRTAAACYKLLEDAPAPSRVIMVGPTHTGVLWATCSVAAHSAYATPLGEVPVDTGLRQALIEQEPFHGTRHAHRTEHCLEVQLPFMQALWPDTPPIAPIIVGRLSSEHYARASDALARLLDEDTLLVISTDFTHYGPRFRYTPFEGTRGERLRRKIRDLDMEAVRHIERLDPEGFSDFMEARQPTICGARAVTILLGVLSRSDKVRPVFLEWRNSGQATGSYQNSVSYVGMAFYGPAEAVQEIRQSVAGATSVSVPAEASPRLDEDERRTLLDLAREAIRCVLSQEGRVQVPENLTDTLRSASGAFVTLKRDGKLRGCVGRAATDAPLWATVARVAPLAALKDPRFPPVTLKELDRLSIEISVLGALTPVRDTHSIQVGEDGLALRQGDRSAVLLPQVAEERGWSRRQFLEALCRKADLPPDAYDRDDVLVYRFSATVFSDQ
ncbi:MAG: AmmeMemoRadiSam system protein B [Candidatus Brocadiia bacterium]